MKGRMMACVAAALVLGGALPAAAQDARGGGPATAAVERLAERSLVREVLGHGAALGLTRDQVRVLQALDRELSARADSAVAALRAADARAEAGAEEGPGPGQRIREAHAAVARARDDAAERAWAILTPEQRQRLAAQRSASRQR